MLKLETISGPNIIFFMKADNLPNVRTMLRYFAHFEQVFVHWDVSLQLIKIADL